MKYLMWLLKAAIFFTLFAFALNNQHVVAVNFFRATWNTPLVLAILAAFTCGLALGVLVMMPRWWKKRRSLQRQVAANEALTKAANTAAAQTDIVKIPRRGL